MEFKHLIFNKNNQIATIALNRPEVLNSFNKKMADEFLLALNDVEDDKNIRVVIITGEGKGFCAGQDLKEALPENPNERMDLGQIVKNQYNPIIVKLRELHKPVIALVKGVAAGAGANIAFACDFVIAEENASFIQSFSKIGLIPDSGGTFFLPRLIGVARAIELTFLGDKLTAQKAYEWGLIYRVANEEILNDELDKLVNKLKNMPTKALGLTKSLINESFNNSLLEQLSKEESAQRIAGYSYDYNEGVTAFLEKRKPNFIGE